MLDPSFITHHLLLVLNVRLLPRDDLVLRVIRRFSSDLREVQTHLERTYIIRELNLKGATKLMDLDGNQFLKPTNVDQLKKFYI